MVLSRRTFVQGAGAILGLPLMSLARPARPIGTAPAQKLSDVVFDIRVPESADFASSLSPATRLHALSGDPASCWWRILSETSSALLGIIGLTTWQDAFILSQLAREKRLSFIHVGEHLFAEEAIRHRLLLPSSVRHDNLLSEDKGPWARQLAGAVPIVAAAGASGNGYTLEVESPATGKFLGQLHSWAMV